jgi:acyl-CoA reductase-like NAD-dependent aldehyde dehydrogenase
VLDAALGEILTTCAKLEYLIDHGEDALKPESRKSANLMFYKSSKVYYEPLGVVAAIVSWNYRMSLILSSMHDVHAL